MTRFAHPYFFFNPTIYRHAEVKLAHICPLGYLENIGGKESMQKEVTFSFQTQ